MRHRQLQLVSWRTTMLYLCQHRVPSARQNICALFINHTHAFHLTFNNIRNNTITNQTRFSTVLLQCNWMRQFFHRITRNRNANSIRKIFGVGENGKCVLVSASVAESRAEIKCRIAYSRFYLLDSNGKWFPKSHNRFSPNHLSIKSVESEMCKSGICSATRCLDFMNLLMFYNVPVFGHICLFGACTIEIETLTN